MSFRSTVRGRGLSAWGAMLSDPSFKTRVSSAFTWGSTETQDTKITNTTGLQHELRWKDEKCTGIVCLNIYRYVYTSICTYTNRNARELPLQRKPPCDVAGFFFLCSIRVCKSVVGFCWTSAMPLNPCLHIIKWYFNYVWLVVTGDFLVGTAKLKKKNQRTPLWPPYCCTIVVSTAAWHCSQTWCHMLVFHPRAEDSDHAGVDIDEWQTAGG